MIKLPEPVAWLANYGGNVYTEAQLKQAVRDARERIAQEIRPFTFTKPAQDVTELVEALEKLARLGNGEHYGNSDGNLIARHALSKYKGAK